MRGGVLTTINWSIFKQKIEKKIYWTKQEVLDLIDDCEQNEEDEE